MTRFQRSRGGVEIGPDELGVMSALVQLDKLVDERPCALRNAQSTIRIEPLGLVTLAISRSAISRMLRGISCSTNEMRTVSKLWLANGRRVASALRNVRFGGVFAHGRTQHRFGQVHVDDFTGRASKGSRLFAGARSHIQNPETWGARRPAAQLVASFHRRAM